MIFKLDHSDYSVKNQRELRRWYSENGLLYSRLIGPGWVDTVAHTLTVNRLVPADGQENQDFPEPRTDDKHQPETAEVTIPLKHAPLRWMLTVTGDPDLVPPNSPHSSRSNGESI